MIRWLCKRLGIPLYVIAWKRGDVTLRTKPMIFKSEASYVCAYLNVKFWPQRHWVEKAE